MHIRSIICQIEQQRFIFHVFPKYQTCQGRHSKDLNVKMCNNDFSFSGLWRKQHQIPEIGHLEELCSLCVPNYVYSKTQYLSSYIISVMLSFQQKLIFDNVSGVKVQLSAKIHYIVSRNHSKDFSFEGVKPIYNLAISLL